jgi:hypothetical protein
MILIGLLLGALALYICLETPGNGQDFSEGPSFYE